MSKKSNVNIKVVNNDNGHLIGKEFKAKRVELGGFVNYEVTSNTVEKLHFKEDDVIEV